MLQPLQAKTIGRFTVLSVLGKGAQGKVYLAEDPHLQRNVAIKTLLIEDSSEREKQIKTLLDEARIVSKLQHPNIVTLYDAGEERGSPYLVFEYVEGTPLSKLIKEEGILPVTRAIQIAIDILDGIGYAHQKGVAHRDLKPGNIMIDANGTARIMDFGIARALSSEKVGDTAFFGTPLYMAPEYITDKRFTPQSDIFAVGMILYEMLAAMPAVKGNNVYETLHNIVNAAFAPPSKQNPTVDARLDDIVLKALAKNPADRYADAAEMALALSRYLTPEPSEAATSEDAKQSTVKFLLRRMQHMSDFPALSQTMSTINKIVSSDQEGVTVLSNVILRDYGLTNKLLKLVNTAFYGQFGGTISTISRAVVILGFDTIRNVAITLLLFEHLQNKSQAALLKDEIVASLFTGILARDMVIRTGFRETEEAFICSMFHTLGKLLVAFYFTEEMLAINKLMEQNKLDEVKASSQVLGVSYEELGIAIARTWHFPEKITFSMRHIDDEKVRRPVTEEERLRMISSLSSELCFIVRNTPAAQKNEKIKALIQRYGSSISITEKQLAATVEESVKELMKESGILNFDVKQSQFFAKVSGWAVLSNLGAGSKPIIGNDQLVDGSADDTVLTTADPTGVSLSAKPQEEPPDAHAVLTAGIQDITNTLVSEYQLNDVLRIILETMYRGMGFTRVLLCVRDAKMGTMNARFGFGENIDPIMSHFKFPTTYTPDVFHAALSQGVDIFISDVNAENIRNRIPDWYRKLLPSQSFILFPIIVDKKPIGMFYGDKDVLGELSIQPKELSLLKTLRNQAVLAIKQKY